MKPLYVRWKFVSVPAPRRDSAIIRASASCSDIRLTISATAKRPIPDIHSRSAQSPVLTLSGLRRGRARREASSTDASPGHTTQMVVGAAAPGNSLGRFRGSWNGRSVSTWRWEIPHHMYWRKPCLSFLLSSFSSCSSEAAAIGDIAGGGNNKSSSPVRVASEPALPASPGATVVELGLCAS
jgi:hypothetical protein